MCRKCLETLLRQLSCFKQPRTPQAPPKHVEADYRFSDALTPRAIKSLSELEYLHEVRIRSSWPECTLGADHPVVDAQDFLTEPEG